MNGSLVGNKIGAMLVIIVVGLIGALIPYLAKRSSYQNALKLLVALASGALFGLAIFHLFLESAEDFEESGVMLKVGKGTYNPSPLLFFSGFCFILLLERVVAMPGSDVVRHSHKLSIVEAVPQSQISFIDDDAALVNVPPSSIESCKLDTNVEMAKQPLVDDRGERAFSAMALCSLLALGIHALFGALIVGIAATTSDVWLLTLAICGHKWAENMALVCQFIEQRIKFGVSAAYIVIFNAITALGIVIGIAVGTSSELVSGIFDSLAAGTILYVGCQMLFEVFSQDATKNWCGRLVLFGCFLLGALTIFGVSLIDVSVGQ
uniref:Zinc/iron permease n=1 Tax=Lankesteria abbotti TaxID=340204 RepID=A0A7S2QQX1_9APIC|mmetsp:Transcript_1989/g.2414  ORF Transcript_1989/g.2414 Transcript_1989/m.2414 type:complete len:321 (+) Transcript_1989:57-1019(+)